MEPTVLSERHGVQTRLVRSSTGIWVSKRCRRPGSAGWLGLLSLVDTLRTCRALEWRPGRDGLVPLLGVERSDQSLEVRLAYVEGRPLADPSHDLLLRCARLLHGMHSLGSVHGDLKPAHLLLTPDGDLVLLDPGYRQEAPWESSVTLGYLSPELLEQLPTQSGPAIDLYALGKIWAELGPVAEPLAEIRARLLAPEPRERYPSATALLEDLEARRASRRPGLPPQSTWLERPELFHELDRAAEQVWRGRTRWIAVGAPSGMGKSRLLAEFSHYRNDFRSLWGGAYRSDCAYNLDALQEAVQQLGPQDLSEPLDPVTQRQLQTVFPGLHRLCQTDDDVAFNPNLAFQQVTGNLLELWRACAARRPLLIVLDDLQWASAATLRLLGELSREKTGQWLVCCSYRSDEWSPPADWSLDARVEIPPLTLEEARRLAPGREDAWLEKAYAWSAGSPFFLLELERHPPDADFSLPERAVTRLSSRLLDLPAATRELLSLLALMGKRVELAMLDALGIAEGALDAAEASWTLWSADGWITFTHDRLREACLELVAPGESPRLHARLARALSRRQAWGRAGYHWFHSATPRRALPYLLRAARDARDHHQFAEARDYWELALEIVDVPEWHLECQEAERSLGLYQQAEQRLARLAEHPQSDPSRVAWARVMLYYHWGRGEETRIAFQTMVRPLAVPESWLQFARQLPKLQQFMRLLIRFGGDEGPNLVLQTYQHTRQSSLPFNVYLALGALFCHEDSVRLMSQSNIPALFYHLGYARPARAVRKWTRPHVDGLGRDIRARCLVRLSVPMLNLVDREEISHEVEQAYRDLESIGNRWEATMGFLLTSLYWVAGGRLTELRRECERILRRGEGSPMLLALALHMEVLSSPDLPDPALVASVTSLSAPDFITLSHVGCVRCLLAPRNGSFHSALAQVPLSHLVLDVFMHNANYATLNRLAAESLPRAAQDRRLERLECAEEALRQARRRQGLLPFFDVQVVREKALLLLLRGRETEAREQLGVALQMACHFRLPLQELLTRREWLRCGRPLEWPDLAEHEIACVRLCRQLEVPWLLPCDAPLWPPLAELASQAEQFLQSGTELGSAAHQLAHTPEWAAFWSCLRSLRSQREAELLSLRQARDRQRELEGKLQELWTSETIAVARLDETGQVATCSPAYGSLPADARRERMGDLSVGLPAEDERQKAAAALQRAERQALQEVGTALWRSCLPDVRTHLAGAPLGSVSACLAHFREKGVQLELFSPPPSLSAERERVLSLVLRELLTNVLKHGDPVQPCRVAWTRKPDGDWQLQVTNPMGQRGASPVGHRLGLSSIRFRLQEIGGRLDFQQEARVATATVHWGEAEEQSVYTRSQ